MDKSLTVTGKRSVIMSRRFVVLRRPHRGFTLVEILVAAALSLVVILAVVQLFKHAGDIVREGRATIEMAGQIRRAAEQVREDVAGLTVPTTPWPTDAAAQGYFEYFEGASASLPPYSTKNMPVPKWPGTPASNWPGTPIPNWDGATLRDNNVNNDVYGDLDDVIMFTARSDERPFVGRFNNATIESNLAEIIIWPAIQSNGEFLLYRRVLLIRPDLGQLPVTVNNELQLVNFYNDNDVSVRVDRSNGRLHANSLSDLTKRENRVLHVQFPLTAVNPANRISTEFPYPLNLQILYGTTQTLYSQKPPRSMALAGTFQGNDVLLDHVTSFDVKTYDPIALVRANGGRALEPSDPGYTSNLSPIGQGAYVDLGYRRYISGSVSSRFSHAPHVKSQLDPNKNPALNGYGYTYCTWSSHYERDGVNQDRDTNAGQPILDEGTDGIDNDGQNGVDDGNELETTPPYPYPLRSLQIKIRTMDAVTQHVRQVTVQNDFFSE